MSQATRAAAKLAFATPSTLSSAHTAPTSTSIAAAAGSSSTTTMIATSVPSTIGASVKAVHPFFAKRKRGEESDSLSEVVERVAPAPKRSSNDSTSASTSKNVSQTIESSPTVSAPFKLQWQSSKPTELLHALFGPPVFSPKLACFDIDGTLIEVKSGARFPKSSTDWNWWDPEGRVQRRVIEYHRRGYSIVFVSNQNYAPHTKPHQNFKAKIPLLCSSLNHNAQGASIPIRIFAATAKDSYRKPNTGIWSLLERLWSEHGVSIDKSQCFYVGDAAGRKASHPGMKHKERDHNDTDKGWATNVGIDFYTPEEFFWQRMDEKKGMEATQDGSKTAQDSR